MGMATRALLLSLVFLLLNVTVTSTVIADETANAAINNPTFNPQVDVKSPATDLWRAVRQRNVDITGTTQVKGPTADTLINVSGQEWREFRRTKLIPYSAYALGGVLLAIILFRLIRGKIKIKAGRSGNKIRRFSGFQRLVHWSVAISFLILGLTGVLLTLGRFGLIPVIGKDVFGAVAILGRTVHNYIGPVFAVLLIIMLFTFIKGNFANWTDIKWFAKGGGLFGGHASAGRYNGGEKAWYWIAMIVGIVVVVSGIVMGFPFFGISQEDIKLSQVIHAIAAIGLLAASFGHIYMGTFAMEGAYEAMQTGYCDENWAKEHHDLWYQELKNDGVLETNDSNATAMNKQSSDSMANASQNAGDSVVSASAGVAATTAAAGVSNLSDSSDNAEKVKDGGAKDNLAKDNTSKVKPTSSEGFDNLKKIEGIGPKIEEVLYAAGLTRYEDIQNSNRDALKEILNAAGSRYKMHEPKSWPAQAELAAKGSWDELSKLQNDILEGS
ncbi:formate dehydrogenase subunit gamma [Cocleimonas sp. KMM 6892]|uniref:formate dehydrogenase subunit gamma n=1 Tax=unclassified Cocleimonas TaxID=2639732 RepID=UPI002DBF34ED|nr:MULTISPECIES: formate dehydrogenase subunit gamma [unclassified Cocleimonas]MEB8433104.1 formate dehydrogenase subunit gamma [Cocleimonas sp. KMM 6892]MEC4715915.1 formate dehydrogenase subunit gamma [Cocleimonas sp. KMM 6895]MEC4745376.1 formate dehydrogenase subunit gamma [Cocleimonas sp. KMM 6896]